jgi:hypothetical protein
MIGPLGLLGVCSPPCIAFRLAVSQHFHQAATCLPTHMEIYFAYLATLFLTNITSIECWAVAVPFPCICFGLRRYLVYGLVTV